MSGTIKPAAAVAAVYEGAKKTVKSCHFCSCRSVLFEFWPEAKYKQYKQRLTQVNEVAKERDGEIPAVVTSL